jgi:hypothetical protein
MQTIMELKILEEVTANQLVSILDKYSMISLEHTRLDSLMKVFVKWQGCLNLQTCVM